METIGKITSAVMILIVTVVCGGFVVMKLWEWLVAPAFSLAPLPLAHAMGFAFFCRAVIPGGSSNKPEQKDKPFIEKILLIFGEAITYWMIAFLFGYLIHLAY